MVGVIDTRNLVPMPRATVQINPAIGDKGLIYITTPVHPPTHQPPRPPRPHPTPPCSPWG